MASERLEQFSSRWSLLISMVGLAVGRAISGDFPVLSQSTEAGLF